jgi:hypothetical protein
MPFSHPRAVILSLVLSEHLTVCGLNYRTAAAAVLLGINKLELTSKYQNVELI